MKKKHETQVTIAFLKVQKQNIQKEHNIKKQIIIENSNY